MTNILYFYYNIDLKDPYDYCTINWNNYEDIIISLDKICNKKFNFENINFELFHENNYFCILSDKIIVSDSFESLKNKTNK